MGSNPVLTAIYTALLDFLEDKTGQVTPSVNHFIPSKLSLKVAG